MKPMAARASGKKLGRPKGSRDKERVLDLFREQIMETRTKWGLAAWSNTKLPIN